MGDIIKFPLMYRRGFETWCVLPEGAIIREIGVCLGKVLVITDIGPFVIDEHGQIESTPEDMIGTNHPT